MKIIFHAILCALILHTDAVSWCIFFFFISIQADFIYVLRALVCRFVSALWVAKISLHITILLFCSDLSEWRPSTAFHFVRFSKNASVLWHIFVELLTHKRRNFDGLFFIYLYSLWQNDSHFQWKKWLFQQKMRPNWNVQKRLIIILQF